MTSLYRCECCHEVVRDEAGKTGLGHLCRAYNECGKYLGKDAECRYVEFEDDGREGVIDLRDGVWLA